MKIGDLRMPEDHVGIYVKIDGNLIDAVELDRDSLKILKTEIDRLIECSTS
jgi:hypothetical protein